MTGISNGGYLTRWQLENHPELYDGGVDWEGTLFDAPTGPNLFTYLPAALQQLPDATARGDEAAHERSSRAGFAPGSEFLWDDHYAVYWDLTQRIYREEFDPGYDGAARGRHRRSASPGTPVCDADYDYAEPPAGGPRRGRKVALTGRIGKPLLTLHGTLDALLPIAHRLRRLRPHGPRRGPRRAAPLLRDRGRQPRRRPLRRSTRTSCARSCPCYRTRRSLAHGALGRARHRAAAEPVRARPARRRRRERVHPRARRRRDRPRRRRRALAPGRAGAPARALAARPPAEPPPLPRDRRAQRCPGRSRAGRHAAAGRSGCGSHAAVTRCAPAACTCAATARYRATAATSRRGTLTVRARFFGNRALRGASSRARHVRGR